MAVDASCAGLAPEKDPGRLLRAPGGFDIDHSVAPVEDQPGVASFLERPVLGKVRPMSSRRTAEKVDLGPSLARYGGTDATGMKLPAG